MKMEDLLSLKIEKPSERIYALSKEAWNRVAKPIDSLGLFEDLICRIAAVQGSVEVRIRQKALLIMCADNGVVREGVSQSGQEITEKVAALMGERKSSVGRLTAHYPMEIFTYDVGMVCDRTPKGVIDKKVCKGTEDFLKGPAMTKEQCLEAIQVGMEAVEMCKGKGIDLIATGEMGIGNTTTSTAVVCALCGVSPSECTGRGAGLTDAGLEKKIRVIEEGLSLHLGKKKGTKRSEAGEVFEALRSLGGADIAALCGVFIGGAKYRIPIVIDGLISAVAALVAERLVPGCRDYMIASHRGKEQAMALLLEELLLQPVILADMALGEGTGAVMLFPLLDMAHSLYAEGTSFQSASIEQYERLTQ